MNQIINKPRRSNARNTTNAGATILPGLQPSLQPGLTPLLPPLTTTTLGTNSNPTFRTPVEQPISVVPLQTSKPPQTSQSVPPATYPTNVLPTMPTVTTSTATIPRSTIAPTVAQPSTKIGRAHV